MLRVCCHRIAWLFTVRVCSLFYGIGWLQTFGQLWACIPTLNQMCNKCLRIVSIFLLDRLIGWIISWTDLYEMDVISLSWNMASLTSKMKSYILLITLVVFNLLQASKASGKKLKWIYQEFRGTLLRSSRGVFCLGYVCTAFIRYDGWISYYYYYSYSYPIKL